MSYRGRPSKGCEPCRARKVKCDEVKPACTRCSRAGQACRYRDQSDLLFRNQTSFAAQKAEDSWRKRAKSRQRSISGGTSQEGTRKERSPSQSALPALPDSSFESPFLTGQQSAFQAAVPGPIPMSTSSRIGPDLRRLAFERFVYDFVVFEPPSKPPGGLNEAIWEYIPTMYHRAPRESCLAVTVDAVSYANFANRCHAPQAQALSEECLGRAIKLIQEAIADKEQALTDASLCAVYLLGVFGTQLMTDEHGSHLAHQAGTNALLQLRSMNEMYTDPVSIRLYEQIHWQQLVGNLHMGRKPPLPLENILNTKEHMPNYYSPSGIFVVGLIHKEAELHARWHDIKQNVAIPSHRGELYDICQAALDLEAEFQAWENTLPRDWRFEMERNTAAVRCTYDTRWRALMLEGRGAPDEVHRYANIRKCWIWTFYRTSRIFLLRDLLEILNWMMRLPEPPPHLDQSPGRLSDNPAGLPRGPFDNTGLQIHQSFATMHLVSVIEKSCAAIIGSFTVQIYGKSDQDLSGIRGSTVLWSLGTMDAVLKAGLVPDAGSPPTPPTSNQPSPHTPLATSAMFAVYPMTSPRVTSFPTASPHPLHYSPQLELSQVYDFSRRPSLASSNRDPTPPGTNQTFNIPQTSHAAQACKKTHPSGHIFDSLPRHQLDGPSSLPALGFSITKPGRIDVAGRREWINRLLYYISVEMGIKKAIRVPTSEGYLETCKAQVEALLTR